MPIGDLLAAISGEKSAPPSSTATETVSSAPKRKANEELRGTAAKSSRIGLLPNGAERQGGNKLQSSLQPTNKPSFTTSSSAKSASVPRPPDRLPNATRRGDQDTPSKQRPASSPANGSRSVPVRPSTKRQSPVESGPKPEPKKRSFAEIMARAKAAQSAGPNLGKIQHKALEPGVSKKVREVMKAEEARKTKAATKQGSTRNGLGVSNSQDGPRRGSAPSLSRGSTKRKAGKTPEVEEKKVKKAALATTGYTGTARPRPGATSSKSKGSSSGPNSASRARPGAIPRYGGALSGSRRQYDDEDDDDMDGFIEYDDDEPAPGYGGGGGYDSVDESDMEAGLSDIDEEERRAEYHGRREDQQQEALEKRLKREKEEKRRKLLEARSRR